MTMFMSTTAPSTVTSSASGASSGPSTPRSTLSRPSMALDTGSTNSDEADLRLKWSGRWSLAHRILALNLITVLLVALSTLYLDVFRSRLSKERTRQVRIEATATALALSVAGPEDREPILATVSKSTESRMRLFRPDGQLIADSWHLTGPTYELRDPSTQSWQKDAARSL